MNHEFSGEYSPNKAGYVCHNAKTFSVGIYKLVPKSSGIGTKKTAVKVRVSGSVNNPDSVYEKARDICKLLDNDEYHGPKNVKVKGGE